MRAPGVSACGPLRARARFPARRSGGRCALEKERRKEGDDRWGRSVRLSEACARRWENTADVWGGAVSEARRALASARAAPRGLSGKLGRGRGLLGRLIAGPR